MKIILNLIVSVIAIGISAYILPGVTIAGFVPALVVVVVLAAINLVIKPIIVLLTLPINILTLGLFSLVINAGLVMLASAIVPGFSVAGFWSAFLFAIVLAVVNAVFGKLGENK